jgi:hypothetical protein
VIKAEHTLLPFIDCCAACVLWCDKGPIAGLKLIEAMLPHLDELDQFEDNLLIRCEFDGRGHAPRQTLGQMTIVLQLIKELFHRFTAALEGVWHITWPDLAHVMHERMNDHCARRLGPYGEQ